MTSKFETNTGLKYATQQKTYTNTNFGWVNMNTTHT